MHLSRSSLAGKYGSALVTGASSGIGRAISMALVEAGLLVHGTTRYPKQPGLPESNRCMQFERSTGEGLDGFIQQHRKLLSSIDILVNNSGSSYFGRAPAIPAEARERQHRLLVEAPRRLAEEVLKPMLSRGTGAIINVSSLAAVFTIPCMEDYCLSKAALRALTRRLMEETGGTGIVVIDFQPGDYRTNFNSSLIGYGEMDKESESVWQQLEKHLQKGPDPRQAAIDVIRAIGSGRSTTVTSGSWFQSRLAPSLSKVLPDCMVTWAIRKYYRI